MEGVVCYLGGRGCGYAGGLFVGVMLFNCCLFFGLLLGCVCVIYCLVMMLL